MLYITDIIRVSSWKQKNSLIGVTHGQVSGIRETCNRNWRKFLDHVSCFLTRFFLVGLPETWNRKQLYSVKVSGARKLSVCHPYKYISNKVGGLVASDFWAKLSRVPLPVKT